MIGRILCEQTLNASMDYSTLFISCMECSWTPTKLVLVDNDLMCTLPPVHTCGYLATFIHIIDSVLCSEIVVLRQKVMVLY